MVSALSPSRASDFMQCPLLYRFRNVDKLPEPPSAAAARGTLVHAVLERVFDVSAPQRTLDYALSLVPGQWQKLIADEPELAELAGTTPEDRLTWLGNAEKLVTRWFDMENPHRLEPSARELFVHADIGGLTLRGIIDRLDVAPTGQIRVVDYKTGRSPSEAYESKALFQMKFYALVLWRARGVIPTMLQLVYLGNKEFVRYQPEQRELEALERKLKAVWTAVQRALDTGDWRPKKSFACRWCHFQDMCPEFGGTPPPIPVQTSLLDVTGELSQDPPTWDRWQPVGCGVESLHYVLSASGVSIELEETLIQALDEDGYDDELGWRHRALVMVAQRNGISGEIRGAVTLEDLRDGGRWLASVSAPEQFESTHLIAVHHRAEQLHVFWPQGHPEHGENFIADEDWLAEKLTGRGMRFEAADV